MSELTLQKDLTVKRMVGYSGWKYQYQLFKNGHPVKNQVSNIEYNYAVVSIHPSDGSITWALKQICELDFTTMPDEHLFVVSINNN